MENQQMNLPEGWRKVKIIDFALKMRSGGTPTSDNESYYGGNIPFVSIEDMTDTNKYVEKTHKTITKEGLESSSAWLVPAYSLMYSIYATLGVPRINLVEVATNQAILNIIPDKKVIDLDFLFYLLLEKRNSILAHSAHTTQSNLNAKIVKGLSFVIPQKIEEQQKTASILSKIDEAIAHTEALIAKYEQIKTGLMQDLLTRGIDAHGHIRTEQTHPFKDSPLGRIPQEWEVTNLNEIGTKNGAYLKTGPFGSSLKIEHWKTEGIPVITIGSLGDNDFIIRNLLYISEEKANELKQYRLLEGDILFSRVAEIGRSLVIGLVQDGWVMSSNFMRLRLDKNVYLPDFIHLIVKFAHYFRKQVIQNVNESGRSVTNSKILNNFIFPKLDVKEQHKIIAKLNILVSAIHTFEKDLTKLYALKSGLMQDLLSGRVRV